MKKRLSAALLALGLCLSLCACSGLTYNPTNSDPSGSADPTANVDLSKDVLAYSAGLSAEDVMLTVNGEAVPADLFLYLLFSNCYNFEYNYYYYYGLTAAMYADELLEDTVSALTYYTVLRQKAAEFNCPLTEEQLAEAAEILSDPEAIALYKNHYSFSDASIDFVTTINYYYDNLLDALVPEPTEEELSNYVYQVKHILLKTVDTDGTYGTRDDGTTGYPYLDDETIAAQRALAEDILARLQAAEGEEQLALFDTLMNEYSEDSGLAYYPDGYEYTVEDSLVEGFTEAALALQPGEISGIVETSYGYHIMLRGELEYTQQHSESYREYRLGEYGDQWLEEANVVRSDLLSSLDVAAFYEAYLDYQIALQEQESAQS